MLSVVIIIENLHCFEFNCTRIHLFIAGKYTICRIKRFLFLERILSGQNLYEIQLVQIFNREHFILIVFQMFKCINGMVWEFWGFPVKFIKIDETKVSNFVVKID